MIPCSYWASACAAVLPSCVTSYVVSVRQARGMPVVSLFPHPASFRSHLAVDTLAFGFILPTTGRIRDFHPLETCAARRTARKRGAVRHLFWSADESRVFMFFTAPSHRVHTGSGTSEARKGWSGSLRPSLLRRFPGFHRLPEERRGEPRSLLPGSRVLRQD